MNDRCQTGIPYCAYIHKVDRTFSIAIEIEVKALIDFDIKVMGEYFKGNFGIFTEWVLTPGNFAQLAPNAPRAGFIFALFVKLKHLCSL